MTETPLAHGSDSSGIFSIAFRDAKHGLIAGGDYQHPDSDGANLASTDDGGVTWQLLLSIHNFISQRLDFSERTEKIFWR